MKKKTNLSTSLSDFGPLNTVTFGFSSLTEEWERPDKRILSKHLDPILILSYIIHILSVAIAVLSTPLLLQIIDSRTVLQYQLYVELEK